MSADTLTTTSRAFYERAKSKLTISIIISGVALLMLGFTSGAGGQAQAASDANGDDKVNDALSAGYGFGAFCFILAFFLFLAAAIYVSPLFCGSPNEKKMIRAPQEIDTNYAAYSDGAKASAPPV
eukprot:gene33118-40060_t